MILDLVVGIRNTADLKKSGSRGGMSEESISVSDLALTLCQSVFDRFFEDFAFMS